MGPYPVGYAGNGGGGGYGGSGKTDFRRIETFKIGARLGPYDCFARVAI